MTKDEVKKVLAEGVATVTFTKKDGTKRVMKATLDPKNLPVVEARVNGASRKENPDVVAVYDMEKSAWRSFRVDSVDSIEAA